MSKRLLEVDPLRGINTYHDYDHSTGKTHITTEQNCTNLLDNNKRLSNDPTYKSRGKKMDYMHFASVPLVVVMEWKTKFGLDVFNDDDMPKIEKLLQSNEYKYLRTVDRI